MLVEDITLSSSQADPGRFTPASYTDSRYAQQDKRGNPIDAKVAAGWAVVSGKVPSGFRSLAEYKKGIRVQGTNKRIPWQEYRDAADQPNEIDFNGVTLREVIADRDDVVEKDRLETKESNDRLAVMEQGFTTETGHGQVQREDYEFLNRDQRPNSESLVIPDQMPRNKGGRPRKNPQPQNQ